MKKILMEMPIPHIKIKESSIASGFNKSKTSLPHNVLIIPL
jgi:hypothetical protein